MPGILFSKLLHDKIWLLIFIFLVFSISRNVWWTSTWYSSVPGSSRKRPLLPQFWLQMECVECVTSLVTKVIQMVFFFKHLCKYCNVLKHLCKYCIVSTHRGVTSKSWVNKPIVLLSSNIYTNVWHQKAGSATPAQPCQQMYCFQFFMHVHAQHQ